MHPTPPTRVTKKLIQLVVRHLGFPSWEMAWTCSGTRCGRKLPAGGDNRNTRRGDQHPHRQTVEVQNSNKMNSERLNTAYDPIGLDLEWCTVIAFRALNASIFQAFSAIVESAWFNPLLWCENCVRAQVRSGSPAGQLVNAAEEFTGLRVFWVAPVTMPLLHV